MPGLHKGVGKQDAAEVLLPAYVVTGGNIMSAVQSFENNVTGTPPYPTARGYNKAFGEDTFPGDSGVKAKSNPLKAFGIGGNK